MNNDHWSTNSYLKTRAKKVLLLVLRNHQIIAITAELLKS